MSDTTKQLVQMIHDMGVISERIDEKNKLIESQLLHSARRIVELEAKVEALTKVMEAARDDLLIRGDIDSKGCRVVNMSATTWDNFCEALDRAALKEGE